MNSRLGVISGSFLEVISENDTTTILNTKASVSLLSQIQQISTMIQSVSGTIGIGASDENALIHDILYGDACQYLQAVPLYFHLCQEMANYQPKAGLTNLLSNFELSMNLLYSRFMNSDRTADTLLAMQIQAFNEMSMRIFLVLETENMIIANQLNEDFGDIVKKSQSMNIALNMVILVLLVVECLMIHFFIINGLKKKEDQFKNILGLFPASIVLQNFILKSYIMKTSNQTFSAFRDN